MPPGRRGKRGNQAPMEGSGRTIDIFPDGVLQHILGFLPARDAVRTCVLARRWCDLWMFATGLRIIGNEDDDMGELREFVDHLLLNRGTAPLKHSSSGSTVQVLRLLLTGNCDHFNLRDQHLVSRHLMKLELAGVVVTESLLDLMGCPKLEQLEIYGSDLYAKKISSESLKYLSIASCRFSHSFRTHIHAPSLVSLLLDHNRYNFPVLESIPSLVDASIRIVGNSVDTCVYCDSGDCNSCQGAIPGNCNCILLEGLSKAKHLALTAESKTSIFKRDLRRCPTFSKLKTLLLNDYLSLGLDLDAITCILKHSPVLEKLTLELFPKGSHHKMEIKGSYSPPVQTIAAISEHLKMVEVKCEVVDERVYKVLKLLCTFSIRFSFE
ncbi:unnamed protein product [Urochloa decumbens]|uniref:F-box domain-containing protein n=1 Tax=Urochloa decumbens TaxID=240449 RepID=A0ABC9GJP0_9POAL